jgi:hypothetical protein
MLSVPSYRYSRLEQQLTTADYPNGAEAPGEKPCAGDGSACCPDKWACLDNGLCYYEPSNLYGRYSCADKDWKSEGCPSNLCTYGELRMSCKTTRKHLTRDRHDSIRR